jgi:putative addiction module CopG family antidote
MSQTMSFALPPTLRAYVDQRVRSGEFGNTSEYLRELIRRDQEEQSRKRLRELIADGLASGEGRNLTPGLALELRHRALEVLRRLRATAGPALPLIGVGGIDSPETAWERLSAGASLVQVYTGWIFEGPALVPAILEGFQRQLDRHGLRTIAEAVGSGLPWG